MLAAKLFDDDDARLQELIKYEILDTPVEQDFEDVVKLASNICNASIGLVTFVDDCRQWFKSKVGWEIKETTKDISFCAHTIHGDGLMEVNDTLEDERFYQNPLVVEGPKVRFYAGVPLVSPRGFKLGTLCVLDYQPRTLTEKQQFGLGVLAKYIAQLLELRLKKLNLAESQKEHANLREKMHRQQRGLARAQRAARIGMFEMDIQSKRLKASEGLCHLFGIKLVHEMDVDLCLSLIHKDDVAGFRQYFTSTLQSSNKRFMYDYRCLKKNTKKEVYIRSTGEIVRDDKGQALQLIGVKQDITEQKWYEKQLEDQNAELLKVNMELDNFVYRVSHDLRAPISSLLGLTEIISGEQDVSKIKELMLLVKRTLEKQDKFIKDILDYSRNSRQELVAEPIDFEEIKEDLFSQFAYSSQYDKVEFIYEVDQALPLITDAYRLRIILNNLVSNSFKYLRQNRDHSFVNVGVQVNGSGATITVQDNGIGIEQKHIKKVFDMFYRATDMHPGSGLGLYIVKETAVKLKGEVSIVSEVGEGTTVKVWVPNLSAKQKSTESTRD